MPPKSTVTREEILNCGLKLVREKGASALNARALAAEIGCSTQPLFSNFSNMEALKRGVIEKAMQVYYSCLEREMQREDEPKYKLSGRGYIRFAGEEKELFKLLFMSERNEEERSTANDESLNAVLNLLCTAKGYTKEAAMKFHTGMWMFVHGIATMIATGFFDWDEQTVGEYMSLAYSGFAAAFSKEA